MPQKTSSGAAVSAVLATVMAAVGASSLVAAVPVSATPAPEEERHRIASLSTPQNPNENLVLALTVGLEAADGSDPDPGTGLTVRASSCGRFLQEASALLSEDQSGVAVWFTPHGEPSASPNPVNRAVGRSIEYIVTVTQGDYDPYTYEGSYSGYGVKRPSCAQLDDQLATCEIDRWSRKKSSPRFVTRPRVGTRVAVTETVANCAVTYAWTADDQVIAERRQLRMTDDMRGATLRAVVTVTPFEGDRTYTRTLRYGTVR